MFNDCKGWWKYSMSVVLLLGFGGCIGGCYSMAGFFKMLFSPSEYYAPFAYHEVDVSKADEVVTVVSLPYPGKYSINIAFENYNDEELYFVKDRHKPTFGFQLSFYIKDQLVKTDRSTSKSIFPFAGLPKENKKGGYSIYTFKAPADLPLRTEIKCKIKILLPDPYLQSKYGPAKLYFMKDYDF